MIAISMTDVCDMSSKRQILSVKQEANKPLRACNLDISILVLAVIKCYTKLGSHHAFAVVAFHDMTIR